MSYLTIQAQDDSRLPLFEVDVPLTQLWLMLDTLVDRLQGEDVFNPRETILVRLIPEMEARADEIVVQWLDHIPANIGEQRRALYNVNESGLEQRPLQGFSAWLCSRATDRICDVYWPIHRLVGATELDIRNRIETQGVDSARHWVTSVVYLRGLNAMADRSAGSNPRLLIVFRPDSTIDEGTGSPTRPEKAGSTAAATVTERRSLVSPASRSWHTYKAKIQGTRQRGDLRILVNRRVLDQLKVVRQRSLQQDFEVGGFLVGTVFTDPEDGLLFVDVSDILAAGQASGPSLGGQFSQAAWEQAFQDIRQRFPDKLRVGWYHTHLMGSRRLQPVTMPEFGDRQVYEVAETAFFSSTDVALHRSFFPEPWHIAMVVDLKRNLIMFYQWKRGEIAPCQGYYVYDHAPQPGVVS